MPTPLDAVLAAAPHLFQLRQEFSQLALSSRRMPCLTAQDTAPAQQADFLPTCAVHFIWQMQTQ